MSDIAVIALIALIVNSIFSMGTFLLALLTYISRKK